MSGPTARRTNTVRKPLPSPNPRPKPTPKVVAPKPKPEPKPAPVVVPMVHDSNHPIFSALVSETDELGVRRYPMVAKRWAK